LRRLLRRNTIRLKLLGLHMRTSKTEVPTSPRLPYFFGASQA
jgi:hypothetical protein